MHAHAAYTRGAATTPRNAAPAATQTSVLSPHGGETEAGLAAWPLLRHTCLDSTNLEARRLIAGGLREQRLVVAESQTKGQCRHDRLWESPADKGIWASFIMPVHMPLERLPQSTLVFAVAVRDGIARATGVPLAAKWPNDLLANGEKCCGLLVESSSDDAGMLILGAGINVGQQKNDFPPYLRGMATSLLLLSGGASFCRDIILRHIATAVSHWFTVWQAKGFAPVRAAWLAGNCTIGNRIILPDGYGCSHGTAHDLDETGALVALTDDGTALHIDSGEIRFAQKQEAAV